MYCKNGRLEVLIEIFRDPNDGCECVMALSSLNHSVDKMIQIISDILNKLVSNNIGRLQIAAIKTSFMKKSQS